MNLHLQHILTQLCKIDYDSQIDLFYLMILMVGLQDFHTPNMHATDSIFNLVYQGRVLGSGGDVLIVSSGENGSISSVNLHGLWLKG